MNMAVSFNPQFSSTQRNYGVNNAQKEKLGFGRQDIIIPIVDGKLAKHMIRREQIFNKVRELGGTPTLGNVLPDFSISSFHAGTQKKENRIAKNIRSLFQVEVFDKN